MLMNIFAGNLARDVDEDELRRIFERHGRVDSVLIIRDRLTGTSRGFGFVEMPIREDAEAAIAALDGKELMRNILVVNLARPRIQYQR